MTPPSESLSLVVDDDGRFQVRGELDADHGRIVDAALTRPATGCSRRATST